MKKFGLALAASLALCATAASAQGYRDYDHGYRDYGTYRHRDWDRGDPGRRIVRGVLRGIEEATGSVGPCRTIVVRKRNWEGDLVTKRIRRCD